MSQQHQTLTRTTTRAPPSAPLLVVSLAASLHLLWSVWLVSCFSVVARRQMPQPQLQRPVPTRKTLLRWLSTLRVQAMFLLRPRMLPILPACLQTSKVTNSHTTLHWLPHTDNPKAISNQATAATLLSLRGMPSQDSVSKDSILLSMALAAMECLHPLRLLQDISHPARAPTRTATSRLKPRSCLLFNQLEMRATALSLARSLC